MQCGCTRTLKNSRLSQKVPRISPSCSYQTRNFEISPVIRCYGRKVRQILRGKSWSPAFTVSRSPRCRSQRQSRPLWRGKKIQKLRGIPKKKTIILSRWVTKIYVNISWEMWCFPDYSCERGVSSRAAALNWQPVSVSALGNNKKIFYRVVKFEKEKKKFLTGTVFVCVSLGAAAN